MPIGADGLFYYSEGEAVYQSVLTSRLWNTRFAEVLAGINDRLDKGGRYDATGKVKFPHKIGVTGIDPIDPAVDIAVGGVLDATGMKINGVNLAVPEAPWPANLAEGDMLIANDANPVTMIRLPKGPEGNALSMGSARPQWGSRYTPTMRVLVHNQAVKGNAGQPIQADRLVGPVKIPTDQTGGTVEVTPYSFGNLAVDTTLRNNIDAKFIPLGVTDAAVNYDEYTEIIVMGIGVHSTLAATQANWTVGKHIYAVRQAAGHWALTSIKPASNGNWMKVGTVMYQGNTFALVRWNFMQEPQADLEAGTGGTLLGVAFNSIGLGNAFNTGSSQPPAPKVYSIVGTISAPALTLGASKRIVFFNYNGSRTSTGLSAVTTKLEFRLARKVGQAGHFMMTVPEVGVTRADHSFAVAALDTAPGQTTAYEIEVASNPQNSPVSNLRRDYAGVTCLDFT